MFSMLSKCRVLAPVFSPASTIQQRGVYSHRQKGFAAWRKLLIYKKKTAQRKKRHIFPRTPLPPDEPPFFVDYENLGRMRTFRTEHLEHSRKRLFLSRQLIHKMFLQDAIDWFTSFPKRATMVILVLLKTAMRVCRNNGWDPARLYIYSTSAEAGKHINQGKHFNCKGRHKSKYTTAQNKMNLCVREIPLSEYYHRLYILKKVPRSLSMDMRLALGSQRAGKTMERDWIPYLTSHTRRKHKNELRIADCKREFNYWEDRRKWMEAYNDNLNRSVIIHLLLTVS
eukprot:GHVL01011231.1.p1 GENE.GHVL01011231.1~~GHVL01011231.1.p1  ORF type:complete len:283 (-),score=36.03 GHVL01011231.1:1401-2249(-)